MLPLQKAAGGYLHDPNGEWTDGKRGLCLKCAKELGLKPVDDLMNKMGLSEEDLDKMSDQMMEVMGDMEDGEDGFEKAGPCRSPLCRTSLAG